MMMPDPSRDYWLVLPGATLSSALVLSLCQRLPEVKLRLGAGIGLGTLLGPLTAVFSVLVWIVLWQIEAMAGLTEPWRYGFWCLLDQWLISFSGILSLSLPVSLPLGAFCGGFLAWSATSLEPELET